MSLKKSAPWSTSPDKVKATIDRAETLSRSLLNHVTPLLVGNPGAHPTLFGSGLLGRYENSVFLLSAAHVLARFKTCPMWMPVDGELVRIEPSPTKAFGTADLGDHLTDPVDVGVRLLPQSVSLNLWARSLDLTKVQDLSEIPGSTDSEKHKAFLLLGYPANRAVLDKKAAMFQGAPELVVLQEVNQSIYERAGYDNRKHLLFRYRNQRLTKSGTTDGRRNLQGASGSPLWAFDPADDNKRSQLVAVFTGFKKYLGGKVYVAARMRLHLQLVRDFAKRLNH